MPTLQSFLWFLQSLANTGSLTFPYRCFIQNGIPQNTSNYTRKILYDIIVEYKKISRRHNGLPTH